jgi:hypothetical protein
MLLTLFGVPVVSAQESSYIDKGLLRASMTFSTGLMRSNTVNGYLHGFLEYYLGEKISVRGDAFYLLFSQSKTADSATGINLKNPLLLNSNLMAGLFYHPLNHSHIDVYLGFQPGIAYSQYNQQILGIDGNAVLTDKSFNPIYGFTGGINYYSGKHFHAYIETRFVRGVHLSNGSSKFLDELRISFGLGFDILTKK